jgi:hypothetical protein
MSAILSPPPSSLYAPLHSIIVAPEDITNTFHNICDNKVVCYTFDLLPCHEHESKLLDGVKLDPSMYSPITGQPWPKAENIELFEKDLYYIKHKLMKIYKNS